MLKSMTGFGKRETFYHGKGLTVEIRSVNHRYCEVALRLPKGFAQLEEALKQVMYRRCRRGRFDVTVTCGVGKETKKTVGWDRDLAKQYYHVLQELQHAFNLQGAIDVALLANFRDIFCFGEMPLEDPGISSVLTRLVTRALGDVETMRRREGKILHIDLMGRAQNLRKIIRCIERRIPLVLGEYARRMKKRVSQLMEGVQLDQDRLAQELALYAERCDVTEELTRLHSHVGQFHLFLKEREPVGRKLDFLLQEMGREVNTIGSKANDADISSFVVQLKSELEKIREQAQNVE